MIDRLLNFFFGPRGESEPERLQRERRDEVRASNIAPGLTARMRWDAQVQEAQGREHGD